MRPALAVVSSNTIEDVAKLGLVYLATPYSKWEQGLDDAFIQAAKITARLLRCGVRAYSPIAHTHPIAVHGKLDALDHSIWLPFDEAIMERADVLLVAKMKGWDESRGIKHEIEFFEGKGKPVYYLDVETFEVRQ